MWPFRRKREEEGSAVRKLVAGLIIGGAIGSIVGRTMVEKHAKRLEDEEDENEE